MLWGDGVPQGCFRAQTLSELESHSFQTPDGWAPPAHLLLTLGKLRLVVFIDGGENEMLSLPLSFPLPALFKQEIEGHPFRVFFFWSVQDWKTDPMCLGGQQPC